MGTDIPDVVLLSSEDFPKLRKKMKILILLFAVVATINAAALQNAKAADEPAAVKAADLPEPAKVEDKLEAMDMAESLEDEGEDDMAETQEDPLHPADIEWFKHCLTKNPSGPARKRCYSVFE